MNSKFKKSFLSSPEIIDKQLQLIKSTSVVQTYVETILQQPDLKLDALPALPDHQKTARKHGDEWNLKVLPLMAKTDADIIDFANQFCSFYDDLVRFAKDIQVQKSREDFVEGLKMLLETVKEKNKNVSGVERELTAFSNNLNSDYRSFVTDVDTAKAKIMGDSGELSTLNNEITAINKAINADIGLMAGGAVGNVLGIFLVVVGAVAEIPTCGGSTPLIAGAVVTVIGGITAETYGSIDFTKKTDQLKKISEEVNNIQAEMLALHTAKSQVTGIVKDLVDCITAVKSLKAGWQALDDDLQELIGAINKVDPDSSHDWLLDELKRAKADWDTALEQAKRLQPDGKIPVKYYNDIKDAFKK